MTGMSVEQAKEMLLRRIEDECRREAGELIQKTMEQAQEEARDKSRQIILQAIQRYAADQTADHTVSTVTIPSDDMKGRVIGREGRNIRAFEKATGVDVIIDDTPGVVVVSCFDPVRREVARLSLERLVQDGRIHPARIEEVVATTTKEMEEELVKIGKAAVQEANLSVSKPVIPMLGRLHFRTSYGQNVLRHSLEVAYLSQVIADELGLDGTLARRCGLLHDIGKSMDHEVEGGHPQIGMEFLRRFNESEAVLNATLAHHGDVPATTPYTPIVMAADAISASRPAPAAKAWSATSSACASWRKSPSPSTAFARPTPFRPAARSASSWTPRWWTTRAAPRSPATSPRKSRAKCSTPARSRSRSSGSCAPLSMQGNRRKASSFQEGAD